MQQPRAVPSQQRVARRLIAATSRYREIAFGRSFVWHAMICPVAANIIKALMVQPEHRAVSPPPRGWEKIPTKRGWSDRSFTSGVTAFLLR
jgi:hypothetical protein